MAIPNQSTISRAIEIMRQVAGKYPRAYGNAHRDNNSHPEAWDFIILATRELNRYDSLFGLNGKRGSGGINKPDLSSDATFYGTENDTGSVIDVIQAAGAHGNNIDAISWNDVSSFGPGNWVDPFSHETEIDYSNSNNPGIDCEQKLIIANHRINQLEQQIRNGGGGNRTIDRGEMLEELHQLDEYYKSPEGLQRPLGLSINHRPDFEGIAAWFLDVYLNMRLQGKSREEARNAYQSAIRQSHEWKQKHPGQNP